MVFSAMWNAISLVQDLNLVSLCPISYDDNHYNTGTSIYSVYAKLNCLI